MWQHAKDKCSIQANDAAIAALLAQPRELIADAMKEINNKHMPLLKKRGEKWTSRGLEKEAKKQKERRKKAQSSANARWNKDLEDEQKGSESNANASSEQCLPSPSPSPSPTPSLEVKEKSTAINGDDAGYLREIFIEECCPSLPLPVKKISKTRINAILARFKDLDQDVSKWREFCKKVAASDFLCGRTEKPFSCGIDWILKPGNFTKILEGNYDNKKSGKQGHYEKFDDPKNEDRAF